MILNSFIHHKYPFKCVLWVLQRARIDSSWTKMQNKSGVSARIVETSLLQKQIDTTSMKAE